MADSHLPFYDLFCHLRGKGFLLTMEQYDLLRQALDRGYGLDGWNGLKRICHRLWVKPSPDFDVEQFDAAFDQYVRQQKELARQLATAEKRSPPTFESREKPVSIPPRQTPASPPPQPPAQEPDAPTAVQTGPSALEPPQRKDWRLSPVDLPVALTTLPATWKALKKRQPEEGLVYELDIDATIAQIYEVGFFSDVVMRPALDHRAELLLLVDTAEPMIPFRPAFQPLIDALDDRRVTPTQRYRFTGYPDQYLYDWYHPSHALSVSTLLTRLHRDRTIVLVISDAGAATRSYRAERIIGTASFLNRLAPCVRDLLWLNPLPQHRWIQTSAQVIAQVLGGRMIPLDESAMRNAAHQPLIEDRINLCPLPPSILQSAA